MGLRVRKRIKIAPGVNVNVGKKSVGVSVGVKGAHYSVNSSGRKTVSAGVPGTGVYYTKSVGGSKKAAPDKAAEETPIRSRASANKKWYQKTGWIILLILLFWPVGLFLMWKYSDWNKIIKIIVTVAMVLITFTII